LNPVKPLIKWIPRFIMLYVLLIMLFIPGIMPFKITTEPVLVSTIGGLLLVSLEDISVINALNWFGSWVFRRDRLNARK